jgi:hypothetical protein
MLTFGRPAEIRTWMSLDPVASQETRLDRDNQFGAS